MHSFSSKHSCPEKCSCLIWFVYIKLVGWLVGWLFLFALFFFSLFCCYSGCRCWNFALFSIYCKNTHALLIKRLPTQTHTHLFVYKCCWVLLSIFSFTFVVCAYFLWQIWFTTIVCGTLLDNYKSTF